MVISLNVTIEDLCVTKLCEMNLQIENFWIMKVALLGAKFNEFGAVNKY